MQDPSLQLQLLLQRRQLLLPAVLLPLL